MKTSRAKLLAALAMITALVTGCAEKEPARFDIEIPSGGKELDAWAAKAAKDNGVDSDTSAPAVARVVCSDLLPKHDDLSQVGFELAKWQSVSIGDTSDLMAIAIYGYCPQYRPLWEGDKKFKDRKVKGVTPLTWD